MSAGSSGSSLPIHDRSRIDGEGRAEASGPSTLGIDPSPVAQHLPVLDGFGFLHRLRETPGGANIPVVVLSARDVTAAERERLAEAEKVLRKGDLSLGELTAQIRALHGLGRHAEPA